MHQTPEQKGLHERAGIQTLNHSIARQKLYPLDYYSSTVHIKIYFSFVNNGNILIILKGSWTCPEAVYYVFFRSLLYFVSWELRCYRSCEQLASGRQAVLMLFFCTPFSYHLSEQIQMYLWPLFVTLFLLFWPSFVVFNSFFFSFLTLACLNILHSGYIFWLHLVPKYDI